MKKLNKLKVSLSADSYLKSIEDVKKEYEALFIIIYNVNYRLATLFNVILTSGIFNILG